MNSSKIVYECSNEICSYIDSAYNLLQSTGKPLDFLNGLNVWLSSSKNEELPSLVKSLYQCTLQHLGVSLIDCDVEDIISNKYDYDALIMFTLTPGVSARAIELIVTSKYAKDVETEKLYIYMPEEYQDKGYIDRRLNDISNRIGKIRYYEPNLCLEEEVFKNVIRNLINLARDKKREIQLKESEIIPEILIVTALELEYLAMTQLVKHGRHPDHFGDNKKQYTYGKIGNKNVIVALAGMGNNFSAIVATKVLDKYEAIKYIIMVGIAGGVPYLDNSKEHIRLGDIVLSGDKGIIQYDMGKNIEEYWIDFGGIKFFKKSNFFHNHPPRPPDATLLKSAKLLVQERGTGEFDFWDYLDQSEVDRPSDMTFSDTPWIKNTKIENHPIPEGYDTTRPRVHIGTIASANTVVKDKKLRGHLKKEFNVKAIEMEGSGIADAAWSAGRDYFVIRSICDYANSDKHKVWQPYAANAAAAFTKQLIEYID